MTTKINPCPRCGGQAHVEEQVMAAQDFAYTQILTYAVVCDKCGTELSRYADGPERAIDDWNENAKWLYGQGCL